MALPLAERERDESGYLHAESPPTASTSLGYRFPDEPAPAGAKIRWTSLLLRLCGVSLGKSDAMPASTPRVLVSVAGAIGAFTLLSWLLGMQISGIVRCAYYGPASLVEESAYTFTSSRNFLRFGFLNSGLLQDFSNSSDPADHPFVYDHMPAGPDLVLAVLLRATGENYRAVRIVLALAFCVGMWFYLHFCQIVLDRLRVGGAGFVILLIGPWTLIGGMERLIYNLYPFLAFAPFVAVSAFHRTGKARYLVGAGAVAFAGSLYLEYSLLSAVLASWIAAYLTKLIPCERRDLCVVVGSIFAGIGLHLLQNLLYLGPEMFVRELTMTLGNRIAGVPSQEELSAFYRSLSLVHHGSHPPRLRALWNVVVDNFSVPNKKMFLAMAVMASLFSIRARRSASHSITLYLTSGAYRGLRILGGLVLWILITVITPICLFPAFAQEVNLRGSGAHFFYLGLGLFATAAFGVRQAWVRLPVQRLGIRIRRGAGNSAPGDGGDDRADIVTRVTLPRRWEATISGWLRHSFHFHRATVDGRTSRGGRLWMLGRGVLTFGICVALVGVAIYLVNHQAQVLRAEIRNVKDQWKKDPYADLVDLQQFAGELFVTNINVPTVGFFTDSPGYGVCGPETITADGDIDRSKCKVAFMRRTDVYDRQPARYFFFFWSPELFPGFADDLPTATLMSGERGGDARIQQMRERLDTHYELAHQNRLFRVYDLGSRKSPEVKE